MISVVTPSLNSGKFIEQTIQSVLGQDYPELDYIVVDGGSTDNTIDIVSNYEARLRWISGKESGQSDAINKGFGVARGDILNWLNSDDVYCPGVLQDVARKFDEDPDLMMVYGDGDLVDESGNFIEKHPSKEFTIGDLAYSCFVCQPSCFFRRSLFEAAGSLNPQLRFAFDLDLWIRFGLLTRRNSHWRFQYVPNTWAHQRMHHGAKTLAQRREGYREVVEVVRRYFGYVPFNWIYGLEEIADGKYDAYFNRSPVSLPLIAKSTLKWIWINKKKPGHILDFVVDCLSSPAQSITRLLNRTKYPS